MDEMLTILYSLAVDLMDAMVLTRLDIAHVVGVVSKYLSNPRKDHYDFLLQGSWSNRRGYLDVDMAGFLDAIKDVEVCCLPTVEAVGKEILLLKCCLQDLGIKQIDIRCFVVTEVMFDDSLRKVGKTLGGRWLEVATWVALAKDKSSPIGKKQVAKILTNERVTCGHYLWKILSIPRLKMLTPWSTHGVDVPPWSTFGLGPLLTWLVKT
ncbi:hypothetical protein V8G54_021801 [Vigna mungo]|uniref:Uncharacterized protein n=1 Tax=Vigna mungo TaxID=3915 RepID=A0AAQ3NGB9_VIGMU